MHSDRVWVLLGKKKSGEATPEELRELDLLLQQHLSDQAAEVIDKIWEAPLRANPEIRPGDAVWDRLEKQTGGNGRMAGTRLTGSGRLVGMRGMGMRWVAAASVLLLVVAGGLWLQHNRGSAVSSPTLAGRKPNLFATQPGSKSKLELPDGTQVWLNGNSKLSFANEAFGTTVREVYLTGEAFFDVVKNEKIPFIIHTGSINITVKGTAFNVKAYPGGKNIETSLVRGLIEITTRNDPDRKIVLKPNEKITIPADTTTGGSGVGPGGVGAAGGPGEPGAGTTGSSTGGGSVAGAAGTLAGTAGAGSGGGQNGVAGVGGAGGTGGTPTVYSITALKKGKSGILAETVWMQRKLEFDDEAFSELAPKMEEWFDIQIKLGSDRIKSRRFSGVIEKESLQETLKAMQLSYPFTYTLTGNELKIN